MTADGGDRSLGAPRFDVVLRGYDRRQVDEHVARLQRVLARMRADLDVARSQPFPAVPSASGAFPPVGPGGQRPRPTPRPRPGGPMPGPDKIDNFSDRMQSILQAAEEEAEEIRAKARHGARAETETARTELADLRRQRDVVLGELTRLRGQLEGMLSAPTTQMAATPPAPVPRPTPGHPGGNAAAPSEPAAPTSGPTQATALMSVAGMKAAPSGGQNGSGTQNDSHGPGGQNGAAVATESAALAGPPPASRPGPGPRGAAPGRGGPQGPAERSPSPAEETTSMRPRGEPASVPAELFRPDGHRAGDTGESPTRAVPMQPGASAGGTGAEGERPSAAAGQDVERTTLVKAVRPGTPGSAESDRRDSGAVPRPEPAGSTPARPPAAGVPAADATVAVQPVRALQWSEDAMSPGRTGTSTPSPNGAGGSAAGRRNGTDNPSATPRSEPDAEDASNHAGRSTSGSRSG